LVTYGLSGITKALNSLVAKGQTAKQKKIVSSVIAELLKIDPDTTAAEADLEALRVTKVKPSRKLLRAHSMLDAAKTHRPKAYKGALLTFPWVEVTVGGAEG
jgi:hypothetical protein